MESSALRALSIEDRERLLKLARVTLAHKKAEPPPIARADRSAPLPLSYAQQRLWFLAQLDPAASQAYHVSIGMRLLGDLDRGALRWALSRLLRRHESLRTTFVHVDGEPRQQIIAAQDATFALEELDFSDASHGAAAADADDDADHDDAAGDGGGRLQALIAREAVRPFDLAQGPLIRGSLVRLSDREHVLLLNQHHIVCDGWSMSIIVNEVCRLYDARCRGEEDPLPPLRVQYADYAVWHRGWFDAAAERRQAEYWTRTLQGSPTVLDLPADRPRPPQQDYAGATIGCELDAELTRGLRALSQRHGTTPFMTLMAGWAALMSRLSGQQDVVIGTPSANRGHLDIEPLIGFFVNMLPLRVDLSAAPTVAQLLAQVKQISLDAQRHQDIPFEQVVDLLNPARSLAHHPLFQVVFTWQNAPKGDLQVTGLRVSGLPSPHVTTRFDLLLALSDTGDTISGTLEYASALFDRETAERYLGYWRTLLAGMVADDGVTVDRLPLMSGRQRDEVLYDWNRAVALPRAERPLHREFEEWARRTPEAIALSHGDKLLRYGELNARANRLAHRLIALGVRPDDRVALCLERGLPMLVAILAVLKAGGGYVPLDPSSPAERLAYMLEDSAPVALLTQRDFLSRWAGQGATPFAVLDVEIEEEADESRSHPSDANPSPEGLAMRHLAYVIYTSGSTGRPKGVMVEHGNVARLFTATDAWFGFDHRDVWTLFHSYAFDFSVWEIWGALRYGGRLVIVDRDVARSPDDFYRLLCREGVTVLNQTPSAFRRLDAAQAASPLEHRLRHVVFGGEVLEMSSLRSWYARTRNAQTRLVNMYGITETTVHVTYLALTPEDAWRNGPSPIGARIPDLRLYVLDALRQPAPIGVTGELYVGGAGVARGYLHRDELTAARFIDDPFVNRAIVPPDEARLYKTGDLCRWRADGSLEYLGRNDQQVKVRGYRIELGEIEARLRAHPAVREVAVIAREDQPGDKQLVAYAMADDASFAADLPALRDRQVDGWERLYDTTYGAPADDAELSDFTGWNSSYTGLPIPREEMREWRDDTVERLRALRPRRVLEIGCGSGLLLLQLAGDCERYVGTDLSARALATLQRKVAAQRLDQVSLIHARADDFSRYGGERFDTIVLNSVVQYFPGVDYLSAVLDGAFELLAPGGRIFIGDVRNFRLIEAFHASVQAFRAAGGDRVGALRDRTRKALDAEGELLVDPDFFAVVGERHGAAAVQAMLKPGRHRNELTRYRYDAVIHAAGSAPAPSVASAPSTSAHAWETAYADAGALREILERETTDVVAITGIPNARVAQDLRAAALLHDADVAVSARISDVLREDGETITGETTAGATPADAMTGVEPQDLRDMARALHWRAEPGWIGGDESGRYHACFYRPGYDGPALDHRRLAAAAAPTARPFSNDPLRDVKRARLAESLRAFLQEQLPAHMVPAHVMLIDSLPLTGNGKLDVQSLPAPATIRSDSGYVAPRTPAEQALAEIWAATLKIDKVGVHDNFFELGGDSILTIAIVAKARERGIDISLEQLFRHQTIAGLIEHGSGHAQAREAAATPMPPVTLLSERDHAALPEGVEDAYGLSMLQLGMIYHNELSSGAYHDLLSLHLHMPQWDLARFRIVLDALARKHPILRTSFDLHSYSEPLQLVHARASIPVIVSDISGLDPEAQKAEVDACVCAEKTRAFDLAQAPLLRIFIHLRGGNEIQYSLSFHHAVLDGWSLASFHAELFREYAALCESGATALTLAPLASDFKTMVAGERRCLASPEGRAFWHAHLRDWTPPTLPGRPAARHTSGTECVKAAVPADLKRGLVTLASAMSVPLRTIVLAAHLRVVAMLSGSDDVLTGVVSHTRPEERDGAEVLGMFLNTLTMRQALPAGSWRDLIRATFATELAMAPHRAFPYFQLFLDNGRVDYHDVVFNYVHFHVLDGLREAGHLRVIDSSGGAETNFQLTFAAIDDGQRLGFRLDYDPLRFTQDRVRDYLDYYLHVLRAMVDRPDAQHRADDCLSDAERRTVLQVWNQTAAARDDETLLHRHIERWAERTPGAIALSDDVRELTYAGLNAHANRIAHWLIARGVKPDDRVGLYGGRGVETIAGLVGILKAGGAYVPLDPAYPAERLAYMIEDSAPKALLTPSMAALRSLSLPAGLADLPALALDDEGALAEAHAGNPIVHDLTGANLAHVIYTSGSTGRPKGVMVEHHSVVNLWTALDREVFAPCGAEARIGLNAALSFDGSLQMLTQLLSGRCIVILPAAVRVEAAALLAFLDRHRIEVFDCTPAQFELLITQGLFDADLPHLRAMMIGGEALSARAWDAAAASRVRCINAYGPTECTVEATLTTIEPGMAPHIGRPLANMRAYVLDAHGQPSPIGAMGEIHIGGVCVARGYLNRPDLTAERFVRDPFARDAGARMYKTGDLGRWQADGTIEYLGRNDFQVKIRGYRIELGEIEAALVACDGVREAVVIVREDAPGDKRLVAYVVPHDGVEMTAAALRDRLSRKLAEFMVPAAFVRVAALPLTPNGKLDRRALPAPDREAVVSRAYEAPAGEVEETIAAIWRELLGVPRVGRHDQFFELGGHSLLAVKLIYVMKARLGASLPLATISSSPTIASLAALIETGQRQPQASLVVPLHSGAPNGLPLFCIHPIGGHVSAYYALAGQLADRFPVYGVRSPEVAGLPLQLDSVEAMAAAYGEAIRSTQPVGPYRLLGWSSGGSIALAVAANLVERGGEVEYLGLIDSRPNSRDAGLTGDRLTMAAVLTEMRGRGLVPDKTWSGDAAPEAKAFEGKAFEGKSIETLLDMEFPVVAPYLEKLGWRDFDVETFEHLKTQLPVTRHHLKLLSTFQPGPVAAPLQLFLAGTPPEAGAVDRADEDERAVTAGVNAVQTIWVDADHYHLLAAPHVQGIGAAIAAFLDDCGPFTSHAGSQHTRSLVAHPEPAECRHGG
jgi:amino acid adenylation domain-containing protein